MKGKTLNHLLFFLLVGILFCLTHGMASGRIQTFTGTAFNMDATLAYIEEHDITYAQKNVIKSRTTYFDPNKKVIGHLVSEYMPLPQFCNYTFTDLRNRYEDGVRLEADKVCLFRKKGKNAENEAACLPKEENQIVGQGFHHFIINHLGAIADGNIFHVKLAIPSRLNQFKFRIRKLKTAGNNLFIRLEIDSWFLRLFTPHVDVVYALESRRLIRYEGISNVADASGKFNKVKIDYVY